MVKKKEDRSDWVAVQPEVKAGGVDTAPPPPPIKAAKSAYQFFQKENSATIQHELSSGTGGDGTGTVVDVGTLGKEVSSRWQALSPSERGKYEELAEQDKLRFLSESHKRDIEALERRERLQKERETLILEDDDDDGDGNEGGRRRRATTRRTRHKRERRAEKKRAKKEQKRKMKKMKMAASTAKKTKDSDDDSDYESDSNSAASSTYEDDSSDDDDASSSSSSSSSSSASSSDSSYKKKIAKRRSPANVSQAVLDRRNLARKEKLEKEQYIEQRQSDVRNERAEQAKRRLEFLLKQSDIFSHFGNVKQEKARLGLSSSIAATTTSLEKGDEGEGGGDCKTIVRNKKPTNSATSSSASAGGNSNDDTIMKEVEEEEERQEVDEHEATYLTVQPSTLRGKMRQYQLEGLNVSFDIAIQEDHSFPPV